MKPLRLQDIKSPEEYEQTRDSARRNIVEVRRHRRVHVGDALELLFENRETLLFQVQEAVRTEKITDPASIQQEIDAYAQLMPGSDELSATMVIRFPTGVQAAEEMGKLGGIQDAVSFVMGRRRVRAVPHPGRLKDEAAGTVRRLRFRFPPVELDTFLDPDRDVFLVVDHPYYYATAKIDGETRTSLIKDLTD